MASCTARPQSRSRQRHFRSRNNPSLSREVNRIEPVSISSIFEIRLGRDPSGRTSFTGRLQQSSVSGDPRGRACCRPAIFCLRAGGSPTAAATTSMVTAEREREQGDNRSGRIEIALLRLLVIYAQASVEAVLLNHFEQLAVVAVIDVQADDDGALDVERFPQHRHDVVRLVDHQSLSPEGFGILHVIDRP